MSTDKMRLHRMTMLRHKQSQALDQKIRTAQILRPKRMVSAVRAALAEIAHNARVHRMLAEWKAARQ